MHPPFGRKVAPLLLDHLIGAPQQRKRKGEAERSGGLEIDEQLDLGRLLDRQIRRLGARKNPAGLDPALMAPIAGAAPGAHQAARRREFTKLVDRGHPMANGQRGELLHVACVE